MILPRFIVCAFSIFFLIDSNLFGQHAVLYNNRYPLKETDVPHSIGYIGGDREYQKFIDLHKFDYFIFLQKLKMASTKTVCIKVIIDKTGKPIQYRILQEVEGCKTCYLNAYFVIKSIPQFVLPSVSGFNSYTFFIPYHVPLKSI